MGLKSLELRREICLSCVVNLAKVGAVQERQDLLPCRFLEVKFRELIQNHPTAGPYNSIAAGALMPAHGTGCASVPVD
eukprot:scaffold118500_cov70-Phaeocystis_antarctica.AAC.2